MFIELRHIAMTAGTTDVIEALQIIEDCLDSIEKRPLEERIGQVNEAIKQAESEGNEPLLFELLAKKRDLAVAAAK